jgi:uncharacterized protein YegP (UPF0339 family)
MPKWHVEVYRGKKLFGQAFRFRLRYSNGRKLCASESYRDKVDCLAAANDIALPAGAEVVDLT